MTTTHSDISDGAEIHAPGYVQSGDPGAVGAGKVWIDTSGGTGNWVEKVRNDADDGWEAVSGTGGGGGGEINTASNVGTAGVGVYKQKTGVDLELKNINAGSAKITVTDDAGNSELDIDLGTVDFSDLNTKTHTHADAANGGTLNASIIAAGTLAHERGGLEADVSAYDGLAKITGGATSELKINWAGTGAPTANEDSGDGYSVGSRWLDTTNDKEYVCLDATAAAAVWTETTGSGAGGGGVAGIRESNLFIRGTGNAAISVQPHVARWSDSADATISALAELGMATAADWIGGSSLEAASSFVYIYVDSSGNVKLYDSMPTTPESSGTKYITDARVNQSGWVGTSGNGLGATAIVYDGDTGEASIKAGMWLGVFTDSAYRNGRGAGSGNTGGKGEAAWALITGIDTGTNTLTVAANNLAFNDNDYLIVIDGLPEYIDVSGTFYRLIGVRYNDSSSNLLPEDEHRGDCHFVQHDNGSNYTTTSISFVDVDTTDLTVKIFTNGRPVHVGISTVAWNNASPYTHAFDVTQDGVRIANVGAGLLWANTYGSISNVCSTSGVWPVLELAPGCHEFTLQWKGFAGTTTLFSTSNHRVRIWVREL